MKFVQLLSVQQWLKNGLILIPAIFAVSSWNSDLIRILSTAILGFSLLASAVYINNDLLDKSMDRLHPEKRLRLIASGEVSARIAVGTALVLLGLACALLFSISVEVGIAGLAYAGLNIFYSLFGKHIALLDLACILMGYWIRLWIGSEIAQVPLSFWVLGIVALLATYLVLIKRLGDVQVFENTGAVTRKTIAFYASLPLKIVLNCWVGLIAVSYLAYIVLVFHLPASEFPIWAYASVPLVFFVLWRYNKRATKDAKRDPLSVLIADPLVLLFLCLSLFLLTYTLYLA